jgi:hypothetical protein
VWKIKDPTSMVFNYIDHYDKRIDFSEHTEIYSGFEQHVE